MDRTQAQSDTREAARPRRAGGFEAARSDLEPSAALPVQARSLLSLQQTAGNRAVTGLMQGRFAPVQRESAEEEEPLQGRFAPVQLQGPEDEELQLREAPSASAQSQPERPTLQLQDGSKGNPVVQRVPRETDLLSASTIAAGHAINHKPKYLSDDKWAAKIRTTIETGEQKVLTSGRTAYYLDNGWTVVVNPTGDDGGTAVKTKNKNWFNNVS